MARQAGHGGKGPAENKRSHAMGSVAQGYRMDDPAGPSISAALPKQNAANVEHRKALPHAQVSRALETIDASGAWRGTKRCLRFIALTAVRSD